MVASDKLNAFVFKIILFYIFISCLHSTLSLQLKGKLQTHVSYQNGVKKISHHLSGDFNESLGFLTWTTDGSSCKLENVPPANDRTRSIGVVTKFWTLEKDKGAFTLNTLGEADRTENNPLLLGHVVCRATILMNASVLKFFDSDTLYTIIKLPTVEIRYTSQENKSTDVFHALTRLTCSMKRIDGFYLKWRSDEIQLNAEDYVDCSNATHSCTQLYKEFKNDANVFCQYCQANEVLEEYMIPITIKVKEAGYTTTTNTSARGSFTDYTAISHMVTSTTITSTMATSTTITTTMATSTTITSTMATSDATTSTEIISDTITSDTATSNSARNTLVYALSAAVALLCISIAVCAVLYYRSLALRRRHQASVYSLETAGLSPRTPTHNTRYLSPSPTQHQPCSLPTTRDITGYTNMASNVSGFVPIYDQINLGHCDSVIPEYSNLDINEPIYEYVECNQLTNTPPQRPISHVGWARPTHLSSFRSTQR